MKRYTLAMVKLACAVSLFSGVLAAPALAQEQPERPRSERDRILERLRNLDRPDSLRADTTDTLRLRQPSDTSKAAAPAAPIMERDSIVRALMALEGFVATEYEGSGARFTSDSGLVELKGKATILREGQTMTADSLLRYTMDSAEICGYGKPTVSSGDPSSSPLTSEYICYDLERRIGIARGARTEFNQGATWYVTGEEVYPVGNDRLYANDAHFTDCDLEIPHYHFSASRVKMVKNDVMVARDVTLNFRDVPVFWLPFIMQSMKQGRRSGLLTPDFSVNDIARTSSGYRRRIGNLGFYWAISEHLGAQLAGEWFADTYTSADATFEYRFVRQFLGGRFNARRFWREEGSQEFTLSTDNSWQPTERTRIGANGSYTSSSDFVRRNTFDPNELNRAIESSASLSHNFDWGGLSLGARRQQYLSDNRIASTLPSIGLTLQPITLFAAAPSEARWYSNATWTGSLDGSQSSNDVNELDPERPKFDTRDITAGVRSLLNLGNLSWSQSFNLQEGIRDARGEIVPDSGDAIAPVDRSAQRATTWSSSLNYQQRIIGTTTITPRLELSGASRQDTLSGATVTAPTRLNFGASLKADAFGFYPGVGGFERVRHRFSPSISFTYSPAAEADSLQKAVLGATDLLEQNRISIGFTQTFEAKRPGDPDADTAAVEEPSLTGEPRRRPQAPKVTLLSISTSGLTYDFVRAREAGADMDLAGLVETGISNNITSDLLPGLSLNLRHDLFAPIADEAGKLTGRKLDPQLSEVTTGFSIGSDSWISRALGFGRREPNPASEPIGTLPDTAAGPASGAAQVPQMRGTEGGLIGAQRDRRGLQPGGERMANVGVWNANIDYTLSRRREIPGTRSSALASRSDASQMIRAGLTYQPTQQWGLSWRSSYSIEDAEFADQWLTLTRDLHEWQAHFDFVRAQNGNFSFNFRVALKSTPDLKVEYEQRGGGDFGQRRTQ